MPIIEVKGIQKKYQIGERQSYASLRDTVSRLFSFKKDTELKQENGEREFWALRDINLMVEPGEVVGIIGRNGAGKSTLLKILSQITPPTAGEIRLRGRVGSLLEVGTGFNPELTGRENIYLNGAILGMRKKEIAAKFDEIVAFAGVDRFLDTPVKRYSSGMYVRLAFAVAAHLEPDILIVDEVLAVGDSEFQKKCLGKMQEVTQKDGRTVLFVSHNMGAIQYLCTSCVWLEKGHIKMKGKPDEVIRAYLSSTAAGNQTTEWHNSTNAHDNAWIHPQAMYVVGQSGKRGADYIRNDEDAALVVEANVKQTDAALNVGYAIYNEDGALIYWSFSTDGEEKTWPALTPGNVCLQTPLPKHLLNEGRYRIDLLASLHHRQWILNPDKDVPSVYITIEGGLSDSPYWLHKRPGMLAPVLPWKRID